MADEISSLRSEREKMMQGNDDVLPVKCAKQEQEITKLREDLIFSRHQYHAANDKLAAAEKERDELAKMNSDGRDLLAKEIEKRRASEAREMGLRNLFERWKNGAEFKSHDCLVDFENEVDTALAATEPPELLGVLKEVESTLSALIFDVDELRNGKLHANLIRTMGGIKALASLRKAMGVLG